MIKTSSLLEQPVFIAQSIFIAVIGLFLSSCVTPNTPNNGTSSVAVGPQSSTAIEMAEQTKTTQNIAATETGRPRLDIIIPVFDPGIAPEDRETYQKYSRQGWRKQDNEPVTADEYVWPQLRRAEAVSFAQSLKQALEETGQFGAVRVTPDAQTTGDLYLLGRILKSNGQEVGIQIKAVDISGREWFSKQFTHEVPEKFYQSVAFRDKNQDPYAPVFKQAADYLVKILRNHDDNELMTLRRLAELRFAAHLTDAAFEQHLTEKNGRYQLASFPADHDPMLTRTRAVRVRDQLFIDGMQKYYDRFSHQMQDNYRIWQQQSAFEIAAKNEAQMEAFGEAVLGVLAAGLGIWALADGLSNPNSSHAALSTTAGVAAGVAGASLLAESFQTRKEADIHRDALEELGESINTDLEPQVVQFNQETVELQGTAEEQFAQWRDFLKKIYAVESIPDKQL